ncbi:hypothetical protein BDM02DRAFT_2861269 [Thelephora ganbajun]|uniref:Uncharacterized protein n=1 Tax=Thelephora ganbajun TaxID=370292 RepID=A0ACB6YX20_THEGA|nr:hypothetical protein BDM02DRAFT_2861269 [Thelephora ganbajun]
MALEQVSLFNSSPSKKSDVYSLAMTSFTVLTRVLPYGGVRDHHSLMVRIKSGERPPRPKNPDGTRWLQDSIWGMITTCWSEDQKQRWEAPAMYDLFSTSSLQEVQKVKSDIERRQRQRGSTLSQITSRIQSILNSDVGVQKLVNELDERATPYRIGNE